MQFFGIPVMDPYKQSGRRKDVIDIADKFNQNF